MNINTEDVYYSPELQGPNPREFNAWRFVGTDKGAARIGPDMIAFGLGRSVFHYLAFSVAVSLR